MRSIVTVLLVLMVLGGFVTLVHAFVNRGQPVSQPIAFNHSVHLSDAAMQCDQCHTGAATTRFAGLPGKYICLDCHDIDEEEGAHPEKDKLFSYVDRDDDIPWCRVALTAPSVFFSHRRHVTAAGLDCLLCHPKQPILTRPPSTTRLVMTMPTCIACHEETSTSVDCLACHR